MSNAESVDACRSRTRMTSVIAAVVVGLVIWLVLGFSFWLGLILGVIACFGLMWFLGRSCDKAAAEAAREEAARAEAARAETARAEEVNVAADVATDADATETADDPVEEAAGNIADEMDDLHKEQVEILVESHKHNVASRKGDHPPAASGHWSSDVVTDSGKASSARGQSALKPSATLADEDTLRDGVGAWRYEGAAEVPTTSAPVNADAAPEPAAADAAVAEEQPATLSAARDGGADDLKRIKGVGPGLEKTLNELGFYHFDQIAAWTDAEVEWVDARLKFKGRIVRDNWIDQARAFAQGG